MLTVGEPKNHLNTLKDQFSPGEGFPGFCEAIVGPRGKLGGPGLRVTSIYTFSKKAWNSDL